jgi:hypothetical protein
MRGRKMVEMDGKRGGGEGLRKVVEMGGGRWLRWVAEDG